MLAPDRLQLAIEIQQQSYALLMWVSKSVEAGSLVLSKRHETSDPAESAKQWIQSQHQHLPAHLNIDRQHIEKLANFFGTYITSSFDFVPNPETILVSSCGCYCPLCSRLAQAPYLRPKKVTKRDKSIAEKLISQRLEQLAKEHSKPFSAEVTQQIMSSEVLRRSAAYSTYSYWLIERLSGYSQGAAILALWREIAWLKSGSPRKKFRLCANDAIEAEQALLNHMAKL